MIPADRVGILQVRARALTERGVVEGMGGCDALLVRPALPSFAELHADREVYDVRATAKLTLSTTPGAPHSRCWRRTA